MNNSSKRRNWGKLLLVIGCGTSALKETIVSDLSEGGFEVKTSSGYREALSDIKKLKPALIILGEGLPVDSFEACWQLRQAVNMPIIILGKMPGAVAWPRAVGSGADLYLNHFHGSELVARVRALRRRYKWNLEEAAGGSNERER